MLELQEVNFIQSKELKELGFPQDTLPWDLYDIHTGIFYKNYDDSYSIYLTERDTCHAPQLELVAKWLRDEKKLHIVTLYELDGSDTWVSFIVDMYKHYKLGARVFVSEKLPTYEDALSAGISEAIKIIKQNNGIRNSKL